MFERKISVQALQRVLTVLIVMAAVGACSTAGKSTGGDQSIITLQEIQDSQAINAYQIIRQLRPRWMTRNRGQRSVFEDEADFARVKVDEFPPREWDHLREIPREAIREIRFLEPREATFLYGTGYNAGLVRVLTKG
jgi:hypothetical protein